MTTHSQKKCFKSLDIDSSQDQISLSQQEKNMTLSERIGVLRSYNTVNRLIFAIILLIFTGVVAFVLITHEWQLNQLEQQITNLKLETQGKYYFPMSIHSNVTAFYLTCCQHHQDLTPVLISLSEFNKYPLKQVIIMQDGQQNEMLKNILQKFPQARLITTNDKVGQLAAIDMGYKQITTPYVFFSEDDRPMIRPGVIQMNVKKLENDSKLLQVWNFDRDPPMVVPETRLLDKTWLYAGFSFTPTVNRMELYRKLPNGYAGLTKNVSYGTGAGVAELVITEQYRFDYYVQLADKDYFKDLRKKTINGKMQNIQVSIEILNKIAKKYKRKW